MRTVLFVDEDLALAVTMRRALVAAGADFVMLAADDGLEALAVLRQREIALVVTDLTMPRLDGFGLLARMLEEFPHIPAIVMTAHNTSACRERAGAARALGFLVKPVLPEELIKRIRTTLDERGESGCLRGISLFSFAQLVNMDRKTCTVSVRRTESGAGDQGLLFFREGHLVEARTSAGETGFAAACRTLSWPAVQITVRDGCPVATDSIRKPLSSVLMEAAQYVDDAASALDSAAAEVARII